MRIPRSLLLGTASLLAAAIAFPGTASAASTVTPHWEGIGRAALAASDGWGSATTGTTGGGAADAGHAFLVHDRAELVAALGGDNATNAGNATPKIIYLAGTIDLNTDDAGRPLTCADYAAGTGYSLPAYLAAYDPATWGTATEPSGPLEDARDAAQKAQARQIQINVGANTTIVGLRHTARILGGGFVVKNVDNVIIRNTTFEDAADCFPSWDPKDGATGNWNSEYDSVTLYNATHVWADHNTFTDGRNPDAAQPQYFGRPYQVHDGQLDVTNGSDYVTASWNAFEDHDKTNLVGSSNTSKVDPGHLRVTFHHNLWSNTVQRAPRVRFGQVDVFNNYYAVGAEEYEYSIGVGKSSQIVAEANYFELPANAPAGKVLYNWGGTGLSATGNLVNGAPVDLAAAFNEAHPATPLAAESTWTPTLRLRVDRADKLPHLVGHHAGIGHL
ncbi:pectate lyase [Kitasatospora terrestris]|uniref:Polysaccharide lyase family 1 protein n=1 Tax=Kitasatospora terrestris TaxID=258051 RepID=A0ABP9EGR6_9ACTN